MSITNKSYIKDFITNNGSDPVSYRWTHGATDYHLGDGLLIYSLIQYMRAKTCVCLGSGGGFIPRIMSQARRDLHDQGIFEGKVGGNTDWTKQDSFLRSNFYPRVILDTTKNAYYNFFVKEDIKIDYLHIDAGHSYEDVKQDFELYSKLLSPHGIISIHDTDKSYSDNYIVTKDINDQDHHEEFANGPSKFVQEIGDKWQRFDLFNHNILKDKPSSTGLTILKHA